MPSAQPDIFQPVAVPILPVKLIIGQGHSGDSNKRSKVEPEDTVQRSQFETPFDAFEAFEESMDAALRNIYFTAEDNM